MGGKKKKPAKRAPRRARPPRTNVIATSGLTKRFGPLVAVDHLDLEVHAGEIFSYLGPNGAGKSTTIRMLLDFLRPSEGTCTVLGGSPRDTNIRARIGYMPGEIRYDQTYTTRDVTDFYGTLRGGVDKTYVGELCERFDLDPSRPIRELSTGNRRKVAIVQAFMNRPELLLLDEPTSGLDPLLQQQFQHLVRESVHAGATVFLSSHVLPEVEALADRVGILRHGKLIEVAGVTALQRRALQRIELHLASDPSPAALSALKKVAEVHRAGRVLRIVVSGDVDPVVKAAAKMKVSKIVTHEADLEEEFLELYRSEEE